jgi:hypothetical protein
MQYDLEIHDESVERCFLEYDEIGYGYDEDENGYGVQFSEATIVKVTWYKDDEDDCDVDDIVTVRVQEVYQSHSPKITITWHDKSYKNNINAVRLLNEAKKDLLSEYSMK